MNNFSVKSAATLAMLCLANAAPAHTQTGSLGAAAGATDLYQVVCSTDAGGVTDHLKVQVKDLPPAAAPWVSVQVIRSTPVRVYARNATDAKDGDAAMSPVIVTPGGNGAYLVAVNKTAAGTELYSLEFHCEAKDGSHTGTDIGRLQNEQ